MMILIPALFVLALVLNVVFRVLGLFVPKSRNTQPRYDYDESENPIEEEIISNKYSISISFLI